MPAAWKARWREIGDLGDGGQGRALRVRRLDGSDPTERALKVLKKPKDPDRRARMVREVRALRSLELSGVPRLVEDNCDEAGDVDELFVVMELVPGPTLEVAIIKDGPRTLDEALRITEGLVEVVASCHQQGLVHRDIKPDNIILRDGDSTKPTLLDFGLSVQADEDARLTKTEQQIGNRFLGLPEYQTPGDDKRDARSDITLCTAILFYALTGRQPMALADGEGRKPHQRPDVQGRLAGVEDGALVPLARLFDVAFESKVSARVQNMDALRSLLAAVRKKEAPSPPPAEPETLVESLWTLHIAKGELESLYFHHRLVQCPDLAPFFDGNKAATQIASLSDGVAAAGSVLWHEVVSRAEVRAHLPRERQFHRAFDHINHVLDEGWALTGAATSHVRWSREVQMPRGREGGPRADIEIASLSVAAAAVVAPLGF